MAITVTVAGETFVAESYDSVHLPGKPARFSVGVSLTEAPDQDDLESWLGQDVTVSDDGPSPWSETRRVVRLRAEESRVTLWGEGGSGTLDDRSAFSVWTETAPADVAEEILERSGATTVISLESSATTAPVPYILQNFRTDRDVLGAIARAYGFAIVDMADGSVAIADTPPGTTHTLPREALAGRSPVHDLRLPVSDRRVAVFEEDGEIDLLEARAAEAPAATSHGEPVVRPGFSPSRDYLETLLEGHADSGSLSRRVSLRLPRGDIHVGDLVESEVLPTTMAVVARRTALKDRGIVSTVELVEPAKFVAPFVSRGAEVREVGDAIPFTLATVTEPTLPDRPGWCGVVVPGVEHDSPLPAQLLAWGGGPEASPSWLPASETIVLVAFLGDSVMPRLVVLGVCHNGVNPPASTDPGVCVLHFGEDGQMLIFSADGTLTVKGTKMELDAERIALKADEIQLIASSIKMQRG